MDDQRAPHPDDRPAGVIGAVAKALELLQLFARGADVHVNQASRELGVSRSTVHRLLTTLMVYGFVEQDPASRAYRPGPALTGIGLAAGQSDELRLRAGALLARIAEATGETAHLMVLQGDHVLCLDSIESGRAVRTPSRMGWNLPSQATASGKALLAELPEGEIARIFPNEMIAGGSRGAPVRRIDLLAELEFIRARGYATNFGESEPDVCAIGVVLRDRQGRARAAVSVTAPRSRGDEAWMRSAAQQVLVLADEFRDAAE